LKCSGIAAKANVLKHLMLVVPRVGLAKHGLRLKKDEDKWALMTHEFLALLSYDAKSLYLLSLIQLCLTFAYSFFREKIDKYCEGDEYTTIMDTEKIQVWMTARKG
jgi:hypothetical protein